MEHLAFGEKIVIGMVGLPARGKVIFSPNLNLFYFRLTSPKKLPVTSNGPVSIAGYST